MSNRWPNRQQQLTSWHRPGKSILKNVRAVTRRTARAAKPLSDGTTINADNLTTEKMKKEPDAEYIEHITDGIPSEGMPAFKGKLTEQEIKDVVAYIRKELQK